MRTLQTLLIVEDNAALADSMTFALTALGWDVRPVVGTVDQALGALEAERPTAAVVDVHLGEAYSWPVAARLRELGVPFAFLSGREELEDTPPEFADATWIPKPVEPELLVEQLDALVRRAR